MSFRLLRYFLAVASNLSFSRAAENLHVAQSTLSQQIQQLEEYYGVQLFNRLGRTITLTPAGLALQESATRLLVAHDQMRAQLTEISNGKHKTTYPLRIFFDLHMTQDPFLADCLIEAIREIQEEVREEIDFQTTFLTCDLDNPRTDVEEILENSQIDFYIIGSESVIQHPEVRFEVVDEDNFCLIISKYHPLYRAGMTVNDLAYLLNNTVLYQIQKRSRHLSMTLDTLPGGRDVSPYLRFEESADVISLYVSLGAGVSIVPESNSGVKSGGRCESISIPLSKFYTLAGYRHEGDNPILPLLFQRFREKSLNRNRIEAQD